MKLLLTVAIALCSSMAHAQLPVFLNEEFNDNLRKWWTGQGDTYDMKVENGKYIITTYQVDNGRMSTISPYFPDDKDYSIEMVLTQKSGSDNNGFGIHWGSTNNEHYYEFVITTNGYYKIRSSEANSKINNWVAYKKINPMGTPNTLRVEKRKAKWNFYINDNEVETIDAMPLFGSRLGITTYTNMVLEVDRIVMRLDARINLPANLVSGLKKENLGSHINTPYDDLSPVIAADGKTIYFGIENSPENLGGEEDGEDVWYTTSTDGLNWSPRKNMSEPVNSKSVNNLAAISADNNMLIFCKNDGFEIRRRTANGWSDPEYLSVRFQNEAKYMEATLSADGKAILFTVKLKQNLKYRESIDERDIYVSLQNNAGEWSAPVNLGKTINTSFDEASPFLAADGRTLYFASSGRPGYGDSDIYMSKRLDDSWTNWSEPLNLGPEINGIGFDAYYTLPAAADYAYMVSNFKSHGKTDLIRIKLPESIKPEPVVLLLGKVLNAKTKDPVSAEILFEDLNLQKEVGEAISDPKTGSFRVTLSQGKNYGIRATATGYLSVNENLELMAINQYTEIQKDLFLVPIEVGESIQLNNVFFEQGRPILKIQSYPELDRLVTIMKENPTIKIELEGHTDNVGNPTSLLKLSQDRVLAVKAYLERKGIAKDRVTGKGYGGAKPIAPNDTEENRQRNRRVEFKITKK